MSPARVDAVDMSGSLQMGAFGDRTGRPVAAAETDHPYRRWLTAVALGGQARYAAAAALLVPLLRAAPEGPHFPDATAVAAHAAVTLASHRRQLGGHAQARRLDGLARRLSTPWSSTDGLRPADPRTAADPRRAADDPRTAADRPVAGRSLAEDPDGVGLAAARIDALIGLAADAVGLGEPALASRLLAAADPEVTGYGSWRLTVRLSWVRAELAMATSRPAAARAPAERAMELAVAAGSTRHVVKSRLIRAAALAGPLDELLDLAETARRHGLVSLCWPAHALAAELAGSTRQADLQRRATAEVLAVVFAAADPAGRRLLRSSPWMPR